MQANADMGITRSAYECYPLHVYFVLTIAVAFRYKSEVGQQKILFRGSFGTQKPGGAKSNAFDIFMKNAANTNVIYFEGRLLALFEAAQPIAMNPYSLKTLGPDLLGANIKTGASFDFGQTGNRLAGTALFLCRGFSGSLCRGKAEGGTASWRGHRGGSGVFKQRQQSPFKAWPQQPYFHNVVIVYKHPSCGEGCGPHF